MVGVGGVQQGGGGEVQQGVEGLQVELAGVVRRRVVGMRRYRKPVTRETIYFG